MRRGRRWVGAALLAAALAASSVACSGSSSDGDRPGGDDAAPSAEPGERPCDRAPAPAPEAARVPGRHADRDITSFDGTRIRAHWFPLPGATPRDPAPVILMGPGWGQPGATDAASSEAFGATSITRLQRHGVHVLTWDPRGFGESEGTVQVNSPDAEGRDVQVLIDWVAARSGVQLDREGDPRVGMIGGSYGGGIQLVTAAADCRVDALVPFVAWHSLRTSLYKADTPKTGWGNLLAGVAADAPVDPHVARATRAMNETGAIAPADAEWFEERGPGDLVEDVTAPTLLVHGTVDTLFTLDEAITNYRILRDNGVPVAMLWHCGGHGTCLTHADDTERVQRAAMAWLDRWVHGDQDVDTGPAFSFVDQAGRTYAADGYPPPTGTPITARGSGTLPLVAGGGAGPLTDPPPPPAGDADLLRSLVLPVTPAPAAHAVTVPIPAPDEPALVVGAPELALTYQGTPGDGDRPTRVFAQLVDQATGLTVGNQITPIPVTLDGEEHTTEVPLEVVAHAVTPSSRLALQLVATTVAYAQPRLGGSVTFEEIEVALPVAEGLAPGPPRAPGASESTQPPSTEPPSTESTP